MLSNSWKDEAPIFSLLTDIHGGGNWRIEVFEMTIDDIHRHVVTELRRGVSPKRMQIVEGVNLRIPQFLIDRANQK